MKNLKLILITLCIFASVLTYATSYTVSSISYVPYPYTGGTSLTLGDDVNSAPIPLGFSFQFFDQTHTSVIINSNAVLAFGNYSAFRYTPGTNFREVYVNMHDIHPGLASHPGNINYYTLGTAPNRIFVVNYYDIVGRKLITILDTQIPNGVYNYTKDLGQLAPGVYVVKLSVENGTPSFERIIKQ